MADSSESIKHLLLFGGNAQRREQVIRLLSSIQNLEVTGALSEEEGIALLASGKKFDFVMIGGRYTSIQRQRIKEWIRANKPHITVTEPGIDYPYEDGLIYEKVEGMVEP